MFNYIFGRGYVMHAFFEAFTPFMTDFILLNIFISFPTHSFCFFCCGVPVELPFQIQETISAPPPFPLPLQGHNVFCIIHPPFLVASFVSSPDSPSSPSASSPLSCPPSSASTSSDSSAASSPEPSSPKNSTELSLQNIRT